MNVLIACEESQVVCTAFRERGHRAFSCDLQECSGGHPEWHIQGDCLPLINGDCQFKTMDGTEHEQRGNWDLLIAHPPCTFLSVAGNRWLDVQKYGEKAIRRIEERKSAADFFMKFINADCAKIAVENPRGYMNTHYKKPTQTVYPYLFGESNNKPICLWLKGLPALLPTNKVPKGKTHRFPNGKTNSIWWAGKSAKERSRSFKGIGEAMAEQWGGFQDVQLSLYD